MPATSNTKPNAFSYYAVADAIAATNVSSTTKLIAYRLASHANYKTGLCNPDVATLAAGTRKSERTVLKAVAELAALGWLTIKHGAHKKSSYTLQMRESNTPHTAGLDAVVAGSNTPDTAGLNTPDTACLYVNYEVELRTTTASQPDTEIDRAVELAAFVKAETGIESKVGPDDAASLDALIGEHGEDTYWRVVRFAVNDQKRWRERITDKLVRFTAGFAFVLKDEAKANGSGSTTPEQERFTVYIPEPGESTNFGGIPEPEPDDPAVREANRLELERLTREFRENRDRELVAA
jgi:hypothetical protein